MYSTGISNNSNTAAARPSSRTKDKDDAEAAFPNVRYFQVHFQHLHETNERLLADIAQLRDAVARLEALLKMLPPPNPHPGQLGKALPGPDMMG
ncbi:MAG: hypothetical protein HOO87_11300 [Methyloglobulus sp.]|nr:hypothetical protein [Methyloglobulus sp.]